MYRVLKIMSRYWFYTFLNCMSLPPRPPPPTPLVQFKSKSSCIHFQFLRPSNHCPFLQRRHQCIARPLLVPTLWLSGTLRAKWEKARKNFVLTLKVACSNDSSPWSRCPNLRYSWPGWSEKLLLCVRLPSWVPSLSSSLCKCSLLFLRGPFH